MPLIPLPPRFWERKLSTVIRLIYPRLVIAITVFSFGIISSMLISYSSNPILLLLSSPNLSDISIISVRITPSNNFSSARIAFNSAIFATNSLCSFSIFSLSRPVRARSLMSAIACACTSVRPKRSIKRSFAICVFLELLII